MTDTISGIDESSGSLALSRRERERLAALRRYDVSAPAPPPDLAAIIRLARLVTGAEIAQVNLIDRAHQETLAGDVTALDGTHRDDALCDRVVAANALVHVADASKDDRFAGSTFVMPDSPMVRLYAGAPLRTPDGHIIGSLCVADARPGCLTEAQLSALEDLAAQVMTIFELRRQAAQLHQTLGELDHDLSHDDLTGLPNRRLLLATLEARTAHGDGQGQSDPGAVLVIGDIDGFKLVNDTYGHLMGDEVLRVVAQRLLDCCRPTDLVARVGGDEFAIVARNLRDADVDAFLHRLHTVVSRPIAVGRSLTSVGFSAGAARLGPAFDRDIVQLADERMYEAKRGQLAPFEELPAPGTQTMPPGL